MTSSLHAADYSFLRFSALAGLGSADVSAGGSNKSESPFGLSLALDYTQSSRWLIGGEHFRTLSSSFTGSKVGMTGMSLKYSLIVPHAQILYTGGQIESTFFQQRNWVPYVALNFGIAQASLFKTTTNPEDIDSSTVGAFLGFAAGLDYPISGNWGSRSELKVGQTVLSSGTIGYFMILSGVYFYL
jgi:hypothetical protein